MIGAINYPIVTRTLGNGLRVVINPDPHAPAVALNIWYDVGSADEAVGAHGFAHLFEHLMFQGSANVASSEHLAAIQSSGGSANATTSFDRTNYFETVPVNALELALWLEADRMAGLQITQTNLETQREVVKEEKRQRYDNVPYGDMLALLLQLNFPAGHHYAHSAIGSEEDLDAAQLQAVTDFHTAWYHPANAVLTLSGDVTVDEGSALVERYFGDIPAGPTIDRSPAVAMGPHVGAPRLDVTRDVPRDMVHLCWRTPVLGTRESFAVGQALDVLAGGMSSRLHKALVRDGELAEAVGGSDLTLSRGDSLSVLTVRPRDGVDLQTIENAVVQHLEALGADGPTEAELDRANAGFEREWLSSLAGVDSRADHLSEFATLLGDPGIINTLLDEVLSITPDEVALACRTHLAPSARAVLAYHAEEAS